MAKLEQAYQDTQKRLKSAIRTYMFDIIAVFIVIALLVLQMGAITLQQITWENFITIIAECIPFFLVAMLLDNNYYKKGFFVGKMQESYKNATQSYYEKADLTGDELSVLPQFCAEYNAQSLELLQKSILDQAVIDVQKFNGGYLNEKGQNCPPIKTMSYKELKTEFGRERAKIILKAKRAKIKGITATGLMSGKRTNDNTDVGSNEREVETKHKNVSALGWWAGVFFMTLITINNVATWGWATVGLVAFKIIYIFARSYMAYFNGYNDIVTVVVSHYARKVDILNQFKFWCKNK